MEKEVVVYTSIVGARDKLRNDQVQDGVPFEAFVDRLFEANIWTQKPAYSAFHSSRRNARAPKILAHLFVEAKYSVWIDGCVSLKVPATRLIEEWLGDYDFAVFAHPKRSCTYQEATECATRQLDSPSIIQEQVKYYQSRGLNKGLGLAETTVLVRRHTPNVEAFNNHWWGQLCRFSVRDQISFMYSAFHTRLKMRLLEGNVRSHPYLEVLRRPAEPESLRQSISQTNVSDA